MKEKKERRATGRPLNFESVEEVQKKIDEYFEDCEGVLFTDEDGIPMRTEKGVLIYKKPPHPPTVTGLALWIGFNSRQSMLNYQDRDIFFDTITRAKAKCEEYAERRLYDHDGANGAKFSLSNNFRGWSDKQEITASVSLEKYLQDVDAGNLDY